LQACDDEGEWVCAEIGYGGTCRAGDGMTESWQGGATEEGDGLLWSFLDLVVQVEGIL